MLQSYSLALVAACSLARTAAYSAEPLGIAPIVDGPLITAVSGTGAPENNGDAGPALTINIGDPFGVALGPDGALYIAEVRNHRLRRVDLAAGQISTVAGCGRRGYAGDGGPAIEAELNEPYELAFDREGNLLFVEMQNHLIRRVDAKTHVISTIAGVGRRGFSGDGGAATTARFRQPHSIAMDSAGALYIADIGNHRIRRVDPATGVIETVAGNDERTLPRDGQLARGNPILGPRALFIDGDDTLWIALREGNSVWRMNLADGILRHVAGSGAAGYSGDAGPPQAATFNGPKGIVVDAAGVIYVADTENHAIRRIDLAANRITTVAGSGPNAPANAISPDNAGDNGPAAAAQLNRPHGICVAPDGALYIGDTLTHRVRRVH
jgi:DNA-binding beta-propeller fold protein YncE